MTGTMTEADGCVRRGERTGWIERAQILAMLLVVFHHSVPNYTASGRLFSLLANTVHLGALAVFFFVSGLLLSQTGALGRYGYAGYLKRRLPRLLIPYFGVSLLMLIPKYLIGTLIGKGVSLRIVDILYAFADPHGSGICPHLWFLLALALMTVLSPLLLHASRKGWLKWPLLALLAVAACLPPVTSLLCLNELRSYLFWYFLGICGAGVMRRAAEWEGKRRVWLGFALSLALFLLLTYAAGQTGAVMFALAVTGFAAIVCLSLALRRTVAPLRVFVGKTFTVYVLSLCVQNLVEAVCHVAGLPWYLAAAGMFVSGLLIPLGIWLLLHRIAGRHRIGFLLRIVGM